MDFIMQLLERLLTFLNRRWQADVLLVHYFPAASSQLLVLKCVKHRTGKGYGKQVKSLQLHESVQITNLSQTKGSPCPALLLAADSCGWAAEGEASCASPQHVPATSSTPLHHLPRPEAVPAASLLINGH